MVRCTLILLAVVLFVSTQNTNGLKCYVCSQCKDVEGQTTEECSKITTEEPTTPSSSVSPSVSTAATSSSKPTSVSTAATSSSKPTSVSTAETSSSESTSESSSAATSTTESTTESDSTSPSPGPEVQSVKLFGRYKRDVLYDNRAEEYGGCFKYTSSDDKIERGCVKTSDLDNYCGTKTDCTVCTDGDGCNSSVSVMASAILAVIGVTILRILQ